MEERFFRFKCFANLSKFPEIIHGISNRVYGNMKFGWQPDEIVEKNRDYFFKELKIDKNQVIAPEIVHGAKILSVGKAEKGKILKGTDGLITREKDIFLLVTIADCLPILIYDPIVGAVAAVHAGWRSIVEQIVTLAIEKFKNFGSEPTNLIVAVGPGICQKHFVVKKDVLSQFRELYPSTIFLRNHDGYVDLKKAVAIDLRNAGVVGSNIEISTDCSVCQNGIYGSFRKEGKSAPAGAAVIGMRG